jgi:DNA invertase Pin-like site-specific DNA recombinase
MASIEDQIAEVKKIAEKYNLNVVDIISESKSAKEPGRDGFNSMLQRIYKGEAEGILTWKLNRLARNPIDGGQISWMLQQNIIKHIQTFEREYNPSDNVLLMQVEFGMANQYVKDLSLDVKRGMRQKAERGWYPISILPFGYIHNPRYCIGADDEIIPEKQQFELIKKLWNIFLSGGYSISEIKKQGDLLGIINRHGKKLSRNAYYSILNNEFYCGYYTWKDKDENIVRYKGKHKAMISLVDFQKGQSLLHGKPSSCSRTRKYDFAYRGLIKCGECGSFVTPDHKLQVICKVCKHKYSIKHSGICPRCSTNFNTYRNPTIIDILYYHCSKSKGKCSQGSITKEKLEFSIEQEIEKISINKDIYSLGLEALRSGKKEEEIPENVIKELDKKRSDLESRIIGLIEVRADKEITAEQFNLSISKVRQEISQIELEIEKVKNHYIELNNGKKQALDFSLNLLERFKTGDNSTKTEILREMSLNLILKDKNLYITMKNSLIETKNR